MTTEDFAALAGVTSLAVRQAIKAGRVKRRGWNNIDENDPVNIAYTKKNKGKRKRHNLNAQIKSLKKVEAEKLEAASKAYEAGESKPEEPVNNSPGITPDDIKDYRHKTELEKDKLRADTYLKQIQIQEKLRQLIPVDVVRARLANFATALNNHILVLPERLAPELQNITLKKGSDSCADLTALLKKHIAAGIKEAKKAIDKVIDKGEA